MSVTQAGGSGGPRSRPREITTVRWLTLSARLRPTATNGATSSTATSSAISVAARVRRPPRRRTPHRNVGQVTKHRITAHSNAETNGYSTTMQPAVRRIAMAMATIRSIRCVLSMGSNPLRSPGRVANEACLLTLQQHPWRRLKYVWISFPLQPHCTTVSYGAICITTRAQSLLQVVPPVEHHPEAPEPNRSQPRLRGPLWGDDGGLEGCVEAAIELQHQTGALVQRKRAEGAVLEKRQLHL